MSRTGDSTLGAPQDAWDEADGAQLDPEALGALMAGLRPVRPSAGVREAVLAQVSQVDHDGAVRTEAVAVVGPSEPGPAEQGGGADGADSAAGADVVPLRRRSRFAGWRTAGLRVAAVVALVGVGVGIGRWSAMDSMAPTEHFAHLNQAQDVQRVTDTMPDGHIATLTWSQDMSMTALALPQEMMAASQGHSLQVWLVKDGVTTSLGLYDPSDGTGFTFIDLMPQEGERVFITQEPEGGSSQPTGEPLVTFDVNADGTTTRATPEPTAADSQA